jgi:hypothetical protein
MCFIESSYRKKKEKEQLLLILYSAHADANSKNALLIVFYCLILNFALRCARFVRCGKKSPLLILVAPL